MTNDQKSSILSGGGTFFYYPSTSTGNTLKKVEVKGITDFYIPYAFTPDGDGLNDYFYPVFHGSIEFESFDFIIFNRWGSAIFQTDNSKGRWAGTSNGENVEEGVYSWIINFKTDKQIAKVRTGAVMVLR